MKQQEVIFKNLLEENHKALEKDKKYEPQYKIKIQHILENARSVG
jgi:hypothetical protein